MRSRAASLLLAAALLATSGSAWADDGSSIKKDPVAPIAGTPLGREIEVAKPKKARFPGLVIAGGIVGGLGAAGVIGGLVLSTLPPGDCAGDAAMCRRDLGRTTILIGAPVAALGLTLLLVGIQPEPDDAPAATQAKLLPSVAVGPSGGVLTWRF
jgi:hypothetical protein